MPTWCNALHSSLNWISKSNTPSSFELVKRCLLTVTVGVMNLQAEKTLLKTEKQARANMNLESWRTWKIENPDVLNAMGDPVSSIHRE